MLWIMVWKCCWAPAAPIVPSDMKRKLIALVLCVVAAIIFWMGIDPMGPEEIDWRAYLVLD